MERKEVELQILQIVKKIKMIELSCNDFDEALTGLKISFDAIDMVYLVLEIKKAFKIEFVEEDFLNYQFNTINSIVNTISYKLSKK